MAGSKDKTPHLLVKTNLKHAAPDLSDGFAEIRPKLGEIGIFGTEVAISVTGDYESDKQTLDRLLEWAPRWHDQGLAVYVHPYTHGPANPSECAEDNGGTPHAAFRQVADAVAQLAERAGGPVVLTYHAAEHPGESPAEGPHQAGNRGAASSAGATYQGETRPAESWRQTLLERSVRFFDLGFRYCEKLDCGILLVSETQLPPSVGSPRIRIGDRPEEVLRTLGGRSYGACWDSGHYLLSVERVGVAPDPGDDFVRVVTHMHIHDVVDSVDHRPLTPGSRNVARYVKRAVDAGGVNSITLEYDYRLDENAPGATQSERILAHLRKAVELVRTWCDVG